MDKLCKCFAKVQRIQHDTEKQLLIGVLFLISIQKIIDDDEYLVDVGCLGSEITPITIIIVPPAASAWRMVPPQPREPPEQDTFETPPYPIQQREARPEYDVDLDEENTDRPVTIQLDRAFIPIPNEAETEEDMTK